MSIKNYIVRIKSYPMTLAMAAILCIQSFIMMPIPPYSPSGKGLEDISGMPEFREVHTVRNSQTYFSVNGLTLHCTAGALSGTNGCLHLSDRLSKGIPVKVTYFDRPSRVFTTIKMVYTIDQEGKQVVSSVDTALLQAHAYESSKKLTLIVSLGFAFITLIGYLLDRLKIISSRNKNPA